MGRCWPLLPRTAAGLWWVPAWLGCWSCCCCIASQGNTICSGSFGPCLLKGLPAVSHCLHCPSPSLGASSLRFRPSVLVPTTPCPPPVRNGLLTSFRFPIPPSPPVRRQVTLGRQEPWHLMASGFHSRRTAKSPEGLWPRCPTYPRPSPASWAAGRLMGRRGRGKEPPVVDRGVQWQRALAGPLWRTQQQSWWRGVRG